jgi:hypothetical protein
MNDKLLDELLIRQMVERWAVWRDVERWTKLVRDIGIKAE